MSQPAPTDRPLHVLALGAFGRAVADRLAASSDAIVQPLEDERSPAMTWPVASVHVLAAWRETPRLAAALDEAAFRWGVPWLPVVLDHPHVRVGPLVVPGRSPCYGCFRGRLAQHGKVPDMDRALHDHYAENPAAGPTGFLPAHVTFATGAARAALAALPGGVSAAAGVARWVDVVSAQSGETRVVRIHGCPRCGRLRDERLRSSAWLADDLGRLAAAREPAA